MVDYSLVLTLVSASGALTKFGLLVFLVFSGKTTYTWSEFGAACVSDIPGLVISGELPFACGYRLFQSERF